MCTTVADKEGIGAKPTYINSKDNAWRHRSDGTWCSIGVAYICDATSIIIKRLLVCRLVKSCADLQARLAHYFNTVSSLTSLVTQYLQETLQVSSDVPVDRDVQDVAFSTRASG